MTMAVPAEIVAALAGWPEVGSWQPMFPLLTIDDSGFPHVCLLSRAELQADTHHVYAVLASPTTIRNLSRRPAATLVVVIADSAHYLKATAIHVGRSAPAGVVLEVIAFARDSLGIPLRPPSYLVTSSLPEAEAWADSAELLSGLAEQFGNRTR